MSVLVKKTDWGYIRFCLLLILIICMFGSMCVCPWFDRPLYKCIETGTVVNIRSNSYRTTYVELSNGTVLMLDQAIVAEGDEICIRWVRN